MRIERDVEQRGLWFEEFEPGIRYLHRPGRTVTEADNVLFTTMTMNTQALHLDAAWAEGQPFGQRLVNSMFTLATIVGASVTQLTQGTIVVIIACVIVGTYLYAADQVFKPFVRTVLLGQ